MATDLSHQHLTDQNPSIAGEQSQIDRERGSVLSDEDEAFLHRVASTADPPLPSSDMTFAEDHIPSAAFLQPLPSSPAEEVNDAFDDKKSDSKSKYWNYKAFVPSTSLPTFRKSKEAGSVVNTDDVKGVLKETDQEEAAKERRDLSTILSKLNLATLNNRVVSLSADSQKLVHDFNLILKDIVSGVPTAYDDLEKFLTQRQGQLEKLFSGMPPFIQALIVGLPGKILSSGKGKSATESKGSYKSRSGGEQQKSNKKSSYIPSLRNFVMQKGAIAGTLRSILTFLETRFPAMLVGTNALMSLAVFVLMFVCWYCHKRGKEVRLAKEQNEASSPEEGVDDPDEDSVQGETDATTVQDESKV